jgi:hypothetical protein
MKKAICSAVFVLVWLTWSSCGLAADDGPAAYWKFDDGTAAALDSVTGTSDPITGFSKYVDGVTGRALMFDGYTTCVTRKAKDMPPLTDAFTIEAWVALQTYPWNWTAIVDQQGPATVTKGQEPAPDVTDEQLKPGLIGVRYESPDLKRPDELDVLDKLYKDWTGQGNDWSARWYGYIEAPFTGEVTFVATADNGLTLNIGERVVIDGWGKDKSRTGKIAMVKGKKYPVVLSYFQDGGTSILGLHWSWYPTGKAPLVPAWALWHSPQQEELARSKLRGDEEQQPSKTDLFFGIDAEGHLGMKLNIDGQLHECVTKEKLPLLKWSHTAATFSRQHGITLYINGQRAQHLPVKGTLGTKGLTDLFIGNSHEKMSPVGTEREASRKTLSSMVLDGLLDELKIYQRALSAEQVAEAFASAKPGTPQPLTYRKMPSGPKDLPKRFTAYYTRLEYADLWEKPWRVGPHPDILVTFDESPVRVLFWRGTSYGASWVTENDIWMGGQSAEDSGTGWGLSEHMADKQCRYSHVRLIENHDARIVVHWRYAVADIRYTINHENPITGWGDWTDEYYTIYPDAVATRKQVLWTTSNVDGFQWQETIFFSQPGTRPEDNIEMQAFTLANMDGQTHTYSWAAGAPEDYDKPRNANIQLTNLKAENRPFIIFEPGPEISAFGGGDVLSNFPWWNHWPVARIPSDGREVTGPDRPSHSSLSNYEPEAVPGEGNSYTAVSLYGMTDKGIESLIPLARSWNRPATLNLITAGFESEGFNKYERAYVLSRTEPGKPSTLKFELAASETSPAANPAFIIKNWGHAAAELAINDEPVKRGKDFRLGRRRTLETTDLIVWIKTETTAPITVSLSPKAD